MGGMVIPQGDHIIQGWIMREGEGVIDLVP